MIDTLANCCDSLFVIGSFHFPVCMGCEDSCTSWFSLKISIGDIITVVGLLGSLIGFFVKVNATTKEQCKQFRKTWLLEVVIKPNICVLDKFYSDKCVLLSEKVKELNTDFENGEAAKDISKKQREILRNVKDEINNVFEPFTILIRSCDGKLGEKITKNMEDLEDWCSKKITDYSKVTDLNEINRTFNKSKQELYATLYDGVNKL